MTLSSIDRRTGGGVNSIFPQGGQTPFVIGWTFPRKPTKIKKEEEDTPTARLFFFLAFR